MLYQFLLNEKYIEGGITAIIFDLFQHETEISEEILEEDALCFNMYVGRQMTVEDTAGLMRALGAKSENDFEDKMWERANNDTLSMEYLQRVCEANGLKYTKSGNKLRYVIQQDKKAEQLERESHWDDAREWCREARRCLQFKNGEPVDLDRAYALAHMAGQVGYPLSFGILAECSFIHLEYVRAIEYVESAIANNDPAGEYVMACLYLQGADVEGRTEKIVECNYKKGAEWCMKAAQKGEPRAVELFNKLIHEDHLNPKSDEAMRVIAAIARRRKNDCVFGIGEKDYV